MSRPRSIPTTGNTGVELRRTRQIKAVNAEAPKGVIGMVEQIRVRRDRAQSREACAINRQKRSRGVERHGVASVQLREAALEGEARVAVQGGVIDVLDGRDVVQ